MSSKPNSQKKQPSKPKDASQEPPPSLQDRQDQTAQQLANWQYLAANPNLSPAAAATARNMLRSTQASMRLGDKAMAYLQPDGTPPDPAQQDPNLTRLLQIPLSPSVQPNHGPSIKPGTSG